MCFHEMSMRSAFYAQCLPVHTIYCTKHMLIYFHWVGLQNTCVGPNPVQTAVNKPDPSFCRLGGVCSLWVLVEMTNFPIRSYKFWFGNDEHCLIPYSIPMHVRRSHSSRFCLAFAAASARRSTLGQPPRLWWLVEERALTQGLLFIHRSVRKGCLI